jgi:hypothetical protein
MCAVWRQSLRIERAHAGCGVSFRSVRRSRTGFNTCSRGNEVSPYGEERKLVAGFAVWQGQKKAATAAPLGNLSDDEDLLADIRSVKNGRQQKLGDAIAAIFNHLGSPIEFDDLVPVICG